MRRDRATLVAGARNTSIAAVSRPVSAALSRPDSVKVMGGMSTFVRRAARLQSCFEHPAHPLPVERLASGLHKLMQEPETMTTPTAATSGDHAHALPASATPTTPSAEERLAGLVILLGDIASSIAGVRALVRDLESLHPGHGHVIGDALSVAGFLAEFGARYGAGKPSYEDAAEMLFSDRAMRAGVGV